MAFFPIILILGNYLMTSPSSLTGHPSGNLFESSVLLENRVMPKHLAAKKIAELEDDKIILIKESFRPYLYFEIFSLIPKYELTKIGDSCYKIEGQDCIICTKVWPTSYIENIITKYGLEEYTIVFPVPTVLNLDALKEKGYKTYGYEQY